MDNLQFVKKLYNGKNCYSDHMSSKEIENLHLKSKLEDITVEMIEKKRIVFLTGNPGDGKTFIIKAIEKRIPKDVYIQTDLNSEVEYSSIAQKIINCYKNNKPAIIAVNEYPFLLLCRAIENQDEKIYKEIINVKKSVIVYDMSQILGGRIAILDLNKRSLMTKERHLTDEIIVKFISLLKDEKNNSVLASNIRALSNEKIRQQVVDLFELVSFGCTHFVTRDILGAIAFLLTACTMSEYENDLPYYSAIFEGKNKLLKCVQQFDPIYLSNPSLDEALWNGEVKTGWIIDTPIIWPNNKKFDNDVDEALKCFKDIKRKYYFENTEGHSLLNLQPNEIKKCVDDFINFESQQKKIKEYIIHAINKLFLSSSEDKRNLHIWTTHRFDVSKESTVVISSKIVDSSDLEILMPRPADWINGMEYTPDHIVLKHKKKDIPKLLIDVDFLMTLNVIENGYPIGLLAPQYEQTAATFLQELSDLGLATDNEDDEIIIANRKKGVKMTISIENGKYGFEEVKSNV